MTQQQESIVTPERFASGMTWEQYLGHIKRNKEKFEYNYAETSVPPEDAAALRALTTRENGPAKALVLGEDWCPDVFRGLPVIARICQAAGIELRIFPRDENLDIMNEFLKDGQHQSIPTVVFYTREHRYIAHWIERPAKANQELPEVQKQFAGKSREEIAPIYDAFQHGPVWASWRKETVREIRRLLEEKSA